MPNIFTALSQEKAILTADELYNELGINPTATAEASLPTKLETKNFLTAQYPILSTPHFLIYLQGPALFVDSLPPVDSSSYIGAFFGNAKVRRLGRAKTTPVINKIVKDVVEGGYTRFYTDKEFHLNTLRFLLEEGANIDKTKCLNRPAMLASIASYLEDLATFLAYKGFDSNKDYLEATPQTIREGNKLTLDDLTAGWDSL